MEPQKAVKQRIHEIKKSAAQEISSKRTNGRKQAQEKIKIKKNRVKDNVDVGPTNSV